LRCFSGLNKAHAENRLKPSNTLSWIVGHLANQEQEFWIYYPQGRFLFPDLNDMVGTGNPPSTPEIVRMWELWKIITQKTDAYLEGLSDKDLLQYFSVNGKKINENIGTLLYRNIYHYWFHLGEAHALRQQLGERDLPEFVGDLSVKYDGE